MHTYIQTHTNHTQTYTKPTQIHIKHPYIHIWTLEPSHLCPLYIALKKVNIFYLSHKVEIYSLFGSFFNTWKNKSCTQTGTVTDEEFWAIFWVGCVIMKDCIIPWRIFQGDELSEEYVPNNHQTFNNSDRLHKCGVNNNLYTDYRTFWLFISVGENEKWLLLDR